ncbi:hypothetical protein BDZ94DRAFT_1267410 [Collybia nuda]|uniref:IPT/TIG domain-containing protein n=1 Tax=Collybia nuda TaxID=64659 RepID=A0A9P5XXY9_9AGAR|nr:hypothetical protein BDZ94DRAFT_1267410 [Collybia nuda]
MSFSSSATATGSRSPSPLTPEAFDSSDSIAIHGDLDLVNSWYRSAMNPVELTGSRFQWDGDLGEFISQKRIEVNPMLQLDDLIEQNAYDDSPPSVAFGVPLGYSSPLSRSMNNNTPASKTHEPVTLDYRSSGLMSPRNSSAGLTKPIPPPASLLRKADVPSMHQKVVRPPKESCYNLPIMFPSIPEGGTKSRVETQVRVTIDLADASSSSDPFKYDRVGSWKWLQLPQGTATKRRTRKQGKIDPEPQDILHLSATVTCASPPHNPVRSCSSCQTREAKRVAKKLAARVRPARSDSDSGDDKSRSKGKQTEDTTSIIQFNCAEVLDFSTGSVVLPLRITCYCRHHREKVGFNVHFTMTDEAGRVIGTGSSRPIMITDDHKTAPSAGSLTRQPEYSNGFMAMDSEWSQVGKNFNEVSPGARAPSKRKEGIPAVLNGKKRPKPYDSSSKPNRTSREGSVASLPSPATSYSALPMTRSPTPASVYQPVTTTDTISIQQASSFQLSSQGSDSSSPDTLITPLDGSPNVHMSDAHRQHEVIHAPSPLALPTSVPSAVIPVHPHPVPFMFFDSHQTSSNLSLQLPIIHRLIPNMGPTHGGIEVTILGANFHPSLQLNCIFGDVAASSTQRWSDNALVCVLPPRSSAGVVAVWFDSFPKLDDQTNTPPSLFTYSDESDRALMELALQVVGLKMTGKIEDAKNVAMRIVGGTDGSDSQHGGNSNMMHLASSASTTRDLRPLLFLRAGESDDFESLIIDFLAILDTPLDQSAPNSICTCDAISHPTSSGQTLLHLAAFLGFPSLIGFLVKHEVDLDARDKNGYTALHFAVLAKSETCLRLLLEAGADREIVDALGKVPMELSKEFSEHFQTGDIDSDWGVSESEDEEAQWGDAEEDGEVPARRMPLKRISRRPSRVMEDSPGKRTSLCNEVTRVATSPPAPSEKSVEKLPNPEVDEKQAASFIEMIQRTLAQFPAPQGMIPNMPQLPLPQFPHLPGIGMPAVPWNALPQIPMVFPVFVPMMPGWPAFLGGEHQTPDVNKGGDDMIKGVGAGAIRTAHELRATWEKWVALAVASTAGQQTEEMPPPMYTPRTAMEEPVKVVATNIQEENEGESSELARSPHGPEFRPVGYNMTPITDQEVNAFAYQPTTGRTRELQKKHDKMLLIFWLPILFVSLLWALHSGVQFTFQTLKTAFPLKTPLH